MSSPPPEGRQGLISDVISRLLAYMDRPWRAVVISILLIIIGVGWVLWAERERLFTKFLPHDHPVVLNIRDLPSELSNLLIQTGADLATVWAIDVGHNTQDFIVARIRGGGSWTISPDLLPVVTMGANPQQLVDFYAGRVVCIDPDTRSTLLMQRFVEDGMHRVCVSRVPAVGWVIAVVYVTWKVPLDTSREEAILPAISAAANDMVKH